MRFSTRSLTIVHLFGCAIVVSHENNKKNSRFHERYLRIIYNDKRSPFNALLEEDCSVLIHERNTEILFKFSKNIAPPQMHEIFKLKDQPRQFSILNSC